MEREFVVWRSSPLDAIRDVVIARYRMAGISTNVANNPPAKNAATAISDGN